MEGYTKVPHDFFKWLYDLNLTGLEFKVILFVFQKTIGWNKESDKISLSQFSSELKATRRGVIKVIKTLVNKGLLVKIDGKINEYRLVNASTLALVNKKVLPSEQGGKKLVNSGTPTIYTTKETIQKDCYTMQEVIEKERQRLKVKK